jgi:hypothetical protein
VRLVVELVEEECRENLLAARDRERKLRKVAIKSR